MVLVYYEKLKLQVIIIKFNSKRGSERTVVDYLSMVQTNVMVRVVMGTLFYRSEIAVLTFHGCMYVYLFATHDDSSMYWVLVFGVYGKGRSIIH